MAQQLESRMLCGTTDQPMQCPRKTANHTANHTHPQQHSKGELPAKGLPYRYMSKSDNTIYTLYRQHYIGTIVAWIRAHVANRVD